jgi:hypothetical protein
MVTGQFAATIRIVAGLVLGMMLGLATITAAVLG